MAIRSRQALPLAGLLLLLLHPAAGADEQTPDAFRARIEATPLEGLPALAAELKADPAKSVEALLEAMAWWMEDGGPMPVDVLLMEIDKVHACTPCARASRLIQGILGVPADLVSFQPQADPEDALRHAEWEPWWKRYGKLPDWRKAMEEEARRDLDGKDPYLRAAAIGTLAALGDPGLPKRLLPILETHEEDLKLEARKAQGMTVKPPRHPLALRLAAARVLIRLGRLKDVPASLLGDPALAEELRRQGEREGLQRGDPALIRGLEAALLSRTPQGLARGKALARLPREKLLASLAGIQGKASGSDALYFASARLLLGEEGQRESLGKALDGEDRKLRMAALGFLLQAGGPAGREVILARFQRHVNDAIDAGNEALFAMDPAAAGLANTKVTDERALYGWNAVKVLGLLPKPGIPPARLAKEIDLLLQFPRDQSGCLTYNLSVALLALEALETAGGKAPRETVRKYASLLCSRQGAEGAWNYGSRAPLGFDWDNSNTQFALLGLRSAALLGVDIPDKVWKRAQKHWDKTHLKDGDYGGGWNYAEVQQARPGGTPWNKPYGSMTCAGICSLLICQRYLGEEGKRRNPLVDKGLAWLDEKFWVWESGGDLSEMHYFYYLYSVERTGVIAERKAFGERDWYRAGALSLMLKQSESGAWNGSFSSPIPDTTFALLFLKRATKSLDYEIGRPEPPPEKASEKYDVGSTEKKAP